MTLMPSRHVRDPRRRYRTNQIRKRVRPAVPPPVTFTINPELIAGLMRLTPTDRTKTLTRIESEKGAPYTEAVLRLLASALREKRKS